MMRRDTPLGRIERYYIPDSVWQAVLGDLAKRGRRHDEGLALLAGGTSADSSAAYATVCFIPRRGHWGGGVRLEQPELVSLNTALTQHDLQLLAQIHSHPGNFGHSPGDERLALSYREGFVSIVIPDFAQAKALKPEDCFVYEYKREWQWNEISREEVQQRFMIEPTVVGF